jgi:hypothetical protein
MILTSPSEDAGQTPPVTTTFDPPEDQSVTLLRGRSRVTPIDWNRVERLHAFVRARAVERFHGAELSGDVVARLEHGRSVRTIEVMLDQARQGHRVLVECAITYFRAQAMRDAQHPEFLGEWLGASLLSRSA